MGVDQPQCGTGRASGKREAPPPCEYWQKKSQKVDRRAVGCNLVVLKSALPQANYKIQAPNPATPVRAIQGFLVYDIRCPVPPCPRLPPPPSSFLRSRALTGVGASG
jgi:hypothetical protein